VAFGLFPAIAAWGATLVAGAFNVAGIPTADAMPAAHTMQDVLTGSVVPSGIDADINGFLLHGLLVMERGYIFTCMILAAVSALLIDRRFRLAALWCLAAALLTWCGLIHAYQLTGNEIDYLPIFAAAAEGSLTYRGYAIAAGYLLMAVVFLLSSLLPDHARADAISD
jgi:AGZA family xanthine/uracil permease-like MFS transporter